MKTYSSKANFDEILFLTL